METGREVARGLKRLSESSSQLHYSSFSVLESLWVLARPVAAEASSREALRLGLRSIMESRIYTRTSEDSQVFNEAFDLYSLGHRDMIDNILYATSLRHGLRFLTVDRELREFVTEKRLENTLMHPDQLP